MTKTEKWILAARPRTLTGAVAPVIIAIAAAWKHVDDSFSHIISLWPAILCLLFAIIMQIDANFINDYYDFRQGRDGEERLGPERACAQGWISPKAMWRAIIATSLTACLVGCPLIIRGGWPMLIIGISCMAVAFLYTTYLSQRALGDVLVVIFFGVIPVTVTYYLLIGDWTRDILMAGIAIGFVTECLLIVNNYRDIDNDKHSGKFTLVVMIGKKAAEQLYVLCGIIGIVLVMPLTKCWLPLAIYLVMHLLTWMNMRRINHGRELNLVLAQTARNTFIFALLTTISILL